MLVKKYKVTWLYVNTTSTVEDILFSFNEYQLILYLEEKFKI